MINATNIVNSNRTITNRHINNGVPVPIYIITASFINTRAGWNLQQVYNYSSAEYQAIKAEWEDLSPDERLAFECEIENTYFPRVAKGN